MTHLTVLLTLLTILILSSCSNGGFLDFNSDEDTNGVSGSQAFEIAKAKARNQKVMEDFAKDIAETAANQKAQEEKSKAEYEKNRLEALQQQEAARRQTEEETRQAAERRRKFREDFLASEAEREKLRLEAKQQSEQRITSVKNYIKDQLEAAKTDIDAADEALVFGVDKIYEPVSLLFDFKIEEAVKAQEEANKHRNNIEQAITKIKALQDEVDRKIRALPPEDQADLLLRFEKDKLSTKLILLESSLENYKRSDNTRNINFRLAEEAKRRTYDGTKDSLWTVIKTQPPLLPGVIWTLTHPPGQFGGNITGQEELSFLAAEQEQSVYTKIHKLTDYEVSNSYISHNTRKLTYSAVYREPNKKFRFTIPQLSSIADGSDEAYDKAMEAESYDLWSDYDQTNAFISIDDKKRSAMLETHVLSKENWPNVNAIVIDGIGNFSTLYGEKSYNLRQYYLPSFSLAKGFFVENSAYAERRKFVLDYYYDTEPKQLTTLEAVDHISSANYKGDIFFSHMFKDKALNSSSDEDANQTVDISTYQASKVIFRLSKYDDKSFRINVDKIDIPSDFDLSVDKDRMGSFSVSNLVVRHHNIDFRVQAGRFFASETSKNDASIFNVSTSQIAGEGVNLFKRAMWVDLMPFGYNADEIGGNFVMHLDRQKQVDILTANFGLTRCGAHFKRFQRTCADTVRD